MGFEFTKGSMEGQFVSSERLYLDADGKVVKDGDPKAATLLVGEGGTISAADAEKYGLKAPKGKAAAKPADADATEGETADQAGDGDDAAPAEPTGKATSKGAKGKK